MPALDGLRGLAVLAVLCYHAGFGWAKGGWLGVSVFFTLSGYLITSLLLREWANRGRIGLGAFWSRRARRLLPAALVTLAGVSLLAPVLSSANQLHHLRFDVLASVGYVANWRFLFAHTSYADLFSAPSPVQHFWSLAVEEQFYLVYPLAAYAALRAGGRRLLAVLLGSGALASLLWSLHLHASVNRVYYGTDTRVAELLAGALLALSWYGLVPSASGSSKRARSGLDMLGLAALAGTLVCCTTMAETSHWVTRGLLPLQAVLSVMVIAAAARPGVVARVLAWRPLAAIGLVSYGLYLYHWPVFLALSPARTHLSQVPCFGLRVAVTGALAWCSYVFLEQPVRRRRVLTGRLVLPVAVGTALSVAIAAVAVTVHVPQSNLAYANVRIGGKAPISIDRMPPPPQPVVVQATAVPVPSSVLIVGDSGMADASPAIQALYQKLGTTTVINTTFPGFGFTTMTGWRSSWPAMVAANRPQLILAMLGGWDLSYIKSNGAKAYEAVLDDVTNMLTAAGGRILWLGIPPPANPVGLDSTVDSLLQIEAAQHPAVATYADPAVALRAADGTAPRWLEDRSGGLVLARKPDGWHFCPDGAALVAQFMATKVAQLGWSPAPPTGWETGDWRSNYRYNDPPGGCDPNRPQNAPPRRT
ncbi:MAG TPA: acyltransferase family protein [Acidimicrobiales bacterium]|nr:acyltransferase family protein [Acidimicrobiales bacterium]